MSDPKHRQNLTHPCNDPDPMRGKQERETSPAGHGEERLASVSATTNADLT